ncbi:MAG: substrate-binding domain-containing protein [Gammaproteobacteria bacterium]|nr:substrate-binding domain-containing protein [Gammaproteobacteria bacterium]
MLAALIVAGGTVSTAVAQSARDQLSIVGSSTVYPFATVVAEQFGRSSAFKTPTVEATGSGGGIKLFCSGIGVGTPDIANSSRRIKASEVEMCARNGVTEIVEVKIGYDGIVIANSATAAVFDLTTRDVFLALAKEVPNPDGSATLVKNPYAKWSDIRAGLPDEGIEVLGPPPTSGTRDAFVELAMEGGCSQFGWIAELKDTDGDRFLGICHTLREDGRFVEAGENDNLIVQKLQANPAALGIFGFSFLDQNSDVVQGSLINGEEPSFDNIADGKYPVSRPLYVYVKKAHIGTIPGIREFVDEFTSERAIGEDGYLSDRGLIPLPEDEYAAVRADVAALKTLAL